MILTLTLTIFSRLPLYLNCQERASLCIEQVSMVREKHQEKELFFQDREKSWKLSFEKEIWTGTIKVREKGT